MNDATTEPKEVMSAEDLVNNLVQDIATGNDPAELAAEFVEDFVIHERPETQQILALLETPSDNLVGLLKGVAGQGYQVTIAALDERGLAFIDGLKLAVKERLTELANG